MAHCFSSDSKNAEPARTPARQSWLSSFSAAPRGPLASPEPTLHPDAGPLRLLHYEPVGRRPASRCGARLLPGHCGCRPLEPLVRNLSGSRRAPEHVLCAGRAMAMAATGQWFARESRSRGRDGLPVRARARWLAGSLGPWAREKREKRVLRAVGRGRRAAADSKGQGTEQPGAGQSHARGSWRQSALGDGRPRRAPLHCWRSPQLINPA